MCAREHIQSSCSRLVSRRSNGIWEECFDKAVDGWLTWHARTPWWHKCHFSYAERNAGFDHLTLILPTFRRRKRKREWCPRMKKELQTFSWSHWVLQGDPAELQRPSCSQETLTSQHLQIAALCSTRPSFRSMSEQRALTLKVPYKLGQTKEPILGFC